MATATSGKTTADDRPSDNSDESALEASDRFERMLQAGIKSALVALKLSDENSDDNAVVDFLRAHPMLTIGASTVVGWAAGFAIRRFNPIRGKR